MLERRVLYTVAFLGGIAGLTWELLWMHYTALSLGVSAQGAALTLVAFSVGMAGGAMGGARVLRRRAVEPLMAWGILEVALGVLGQTLAIGFATLAQLDAQTYAASPGLAPMVQGLGMFAIVALPSAAMGATIPVFADVAARRHKSIAWLYASNVAGASLGIVLATFVFVPSAGIGATVDFASTLDLAVGAALIIGAMRSQREAPAARPAAPADPGDPRPLTLRHAMLLVTATGASTFALEVAWFRSLRAAFQATTESFAMVLFAVLISLSVGGALAPRLRRAGRIPLAAVATAAAVVVLVSTPLVERTDRIVLWFALDPRYEVVLLGRLGLALLALGPSMLLIGIVLPWCLESFPSPADAAKLYAANTSGAVVGSLATAWLLLPTLGFAVSAWLAAAVLGAAALAVDAGIRRHGAIALAAAALVAWWFASDVGRLRAQINGTVEHTVLATKEGPDATVSVIEHDAARFLVIDGFHATGTSTGEHYMAWMGHLPMLMHPDPEQALVICFGTGQTANAVRRERPRHLDVVDVSPSVFAMAEWFPENDGVLDDPLVDHHVMDGRAWLRRTDTIYDVITLEPMPPTFAGSNALYSEEFYRLAADRLAPEGVVAQWLPFHLVDPEEAASVTATFLAVFADAHLWIDRSGTGILLGRLPGAAGSQLWPGLDRRSIGRALPAEQITAAVVAGPSGLAEYAKAGEVITDDNQRLSYGFGRMRWWRQGGGIEDTIRYQHEFLAAMARPGPTGAKLEAFLAAHPAPGVPAR